MSINLRCIKIIVGWWYYESKLFTTDYSLCKNWPMLSKGYFLQLFVHFQSANDVVFQRILLYDRHLFCRQKYLYIQWVLLLNHVLLHFFQSENPVLNISIQFHFLPWMKLIKRISKFMNYTFIFQKQLRSINKKFCWNVWLNSWFVPF